MVRLSLLLTMLAATTLGGAALLPACASSGNDGGFGPNGNASSSGGGGGSGGSGSGSLSGSSSGGVTGGGATMPVSIDDCTGKLQPSTVMALEGGGPVDPAMKWLYPFDATVFPGGLLAPVLQWTPQAAGNADGVYLHLSSKLFDYKGCFGSTNPADLSVPDKAWSAAWAQSNGPSDPLKVELTTISGGKVSGPITESWTFALGNLRGVVYYNTYTSPQVGNNGAVMAIQPGQMKPTPFLVVNGQSPTGPCISCHSVSANGAMIVAQHHQYPGGLIDSDSYDLLANATPMTGSPTATTAADDWGFSAVYPDGSLILTDGQPGTTGQIFPAGAGNNPGMEGPKTTQMYDPKTGNTLNFTAQGVSSQHWMMPSFSPDGKKIVFNDTDNFGGHNLVVMDFDKGSRTFSNPKQIFIDASGYPSWPFFTPDSTQVVFTLDSSANFGSTTDPPNNDVAKGDLTIVDVASGTSHTLDAANGVGPSGASYLPYPGRDEHLSFYPTVSPVATAGYFWVFFTSRRNYGNTLVDPNDGPASKKLWVSAISIGGKPGTDPSHPAFYLPGQELQSGNIRAFAALSPCKQTGNSCQSGIDCCGGACNGGMCGVPSGCSGAEEKCTTAADCCSGKNLQCIDGFCSTVAQ